jgi:DNA-binding CsgD family transcriptional regulator
MANEDVKYKMLTDPQLLAAHAKSPLFYTMFDSLVTGVLFLGHDGRLRYANKQAIKLLRQYDALSVQQEGLRAKQPLLNDRLQQLIRDTLAARQQNTSVKMNGCHGGIIGLRCSQRRAPLILKIVPLYFPDNSVSDISSTVHVAVFLTDPDQEHLVCQHMLMEHYGLNAREAGICQLFINTPFLEDIAERSGVSLESVRTYMKAIYEKTGQHSQAELMRLLMTLRVNFMADE